MPRISFHLVVYRYEAIIAIIILLLTGSITVSSKDPNRAFPPVQRYPYKIALTFDDGPHPYYTEKIISILQAQNARATFFLVGQKITEYPDLAKRLLYSGNEIAGHTLSHRNLSHLADAEIKKELSSTRALIRVITGRDCGFFRPPGGQFSRKVTDVSDSLGLSMVLWTVFPKDHEENSSKVIVDKVLAQASNNGVVLLHSGREPTLEALPIILTELKKRGFQFVTISELYHSSRLEDLAWLTKPYSAQKALAPGLKGYGG